MNRFDDIYEFRMAELSDLDKIVQFMDVNWKKGGILSNKTFMEYEFGNNDVLNIILAIRKENQEIEGLWGFYPYSQDEAYLDVAGGPWTVRQNANNLPFLGNEIMNRAKEIINYRTMIGVGDNPNTSGFYHRRIRKDITGYLTHYYRLNNLETYKIAVVNDKKIEKFQQSNVEIVHLDEIDNVPEYFWEGIDKNKVPYKDKNYISKRFFNHVVYKYEIFGVKEGDVVVALAIFRVVNIEGSKAIRWVDYIGEHKYISHMGKFLNNYLIEKNAEYIDFYGYGFIDAFFEKAGFNIFTEEDRNIIPNYFEPFLQKNVDIGFSIPNEQCVMCKGDGDQDRPNYWEEK